jgi:Type IV secretion system pilin
MNWHTLMNGFATNISPGNLPTKAGDGDEALHTIINIVLQFAGAISFLIIVVSGLRYILAAGDADRAARAKNGIIYALVGLAIALIAQAVVSFVLGPL